MNRTIDYWLEPEIEILKMVDPKPLGHVAVWLRIYHFNISISDPNPVVDGSIPDYVHFAQGVSTECGQMTPRRVTAGICHHPLMKVCSKPELCTCAHFE